MPDDETRFFLDQHWSHRVSAYSDDFTDQEAIAAILCITRGNPRLIDYLMIQVEHILVANELQVVMKEAVETTRENFIIRLKHGISMFIKPACKTLGFSHRDRRAVPSC
ncbi:hypothetical protein KSC_035030 [Ktedonobacter sp. SOSP1-52]|uniref:hypothetical protein n=1 Tax=Ktedonobacter sp. SOSP1-52 TaxID=2778366 RepID=UPI0019152B95|nr:hypothetical protein [Ktedonobacter sp. SOSP1-52]GHO64611.1 hypothetical protein KSC_035030 [Ktedonobacter sp. SOSP1-52]